MLGRHPLSTELTCAGPSGVLILRHPRWADYDAWSALRRESEATLRPWEPEWSDAHLSRGAYRLRLNRFKKMVLQDQAYLFHVFRAEDDRLVGACNLTHIERGAAQSARVGYWIGQPFERRGYGRTALKAVSEFAFNSLGLHRLEAAVQAANTASIAMLTAQGFEREGTARGYLKINGDWADHEIYARLSR